MTKFQNNFFQADSHVLVEGNRIDLNTHELAEVENILGRNLRIPSSGQTDHSTVSFSIYQQTVTNEQATTRLNGSEAWPELHLLTPKLLRRKLKVDLSIEVYTKLLAQNREAYGDNLVLQPYQACKFGRVTLFGEAFRSEFARGARDRCVLLDYLATEAKSGSDCQTYPGIIQYFMRIDLILKSGSVSFSVPHFDVVKFYNRAIPTQQRELERMKVCSCVFYSRQLEEDRCVPS
jgi:hypothetical protein